VSLVVVKQWLISPTSYEQLLQTKLMNAFFSGSTSFDKIMYAEKVLFKMLVK
jgi:hypothetical protein